MKPNFKDGYPYSKEFCTALLSLYHCQADKKVMGMIKDELGGKNHDRVCKGTKRCVIAEGLTFDDYQTCLFDGKTIYRGQMLFENKKHEVYLVKKHKIALNRDNDKRAVQADRITILARGYVALSP